ncbi:MAG TPA: hypothetical protein PKN75_07240 [Bacteroidia bacterium]|nr:hypothetical protein [Bacteroidia bacterium]HNU33371.1 hypothetical protein [Bacteroidia bacterium]
MAIKSFEVKSYVINNGFKNSATWGGVSIKIQGYLVCYSDDGYRFIIYGLHPSSPIAAPTYIPANKVGAIFIPFKELFNYIDLARNEKPVYAYLNSDNPDWNSIKTSTEPVGEEES